MAELSSGDRDPYGTQSCKYLLSGPLQNKKWSTSDKEQNCIWKENKVSKSVACSEDGAVGTL